MIKIKLSKSKILAYISCPRAFKFRYISNLPYPANKYMKEGIEVHTILEKFFNHIDGVINPEKEYPEIIKGIAEDKYEQFQAYFENFVKFEIRRRSFYKDVIDWYKPMRREKKLFLEDFNAIIDRVDYLPDHGFIIVDYKTGNFYPKEWEKVRFELTFYAFMFWKRYNRIIWKIAIIPLKYIPQRFFDSKQIYPYEEEITKAHYDEMFRIVEWVKAQIEAEIFPPKKTYCWGCPYNNLCSSLENKKEREKILGDWEVDSE